MKLECIIGIIIDGKRVRVGDIIDEQHPLYETAILFAQPREVKDKVVKTVYFAQIDGKQKQIDDEPKSISDIARERQYNPPASMKKK